VSVVFLQAILPVVASFQEFPYSVISGKFQRKKIMSTGFSCLSHFYFLFGPFLSYAANLSASWQQEESWSTRG
jgi:hypothetical protein